MQAGIRIYYKQPSISEVVNKLIQQHADMHALTNIPIYDWCDALDLLDLLKRALSARLRPKGHLGREGCWWIQVSQGGARVYSNETYIFTYRLWSCVIAGHDPPPRRTSNKRGLE